MAFSIFTRTDETVEEVSTSDQIHLFTIQSFSQAKDVADAIKEGQAAIANLSKLDTAQAQRTIDFLTGIMYAVDGKIQVVGPRVILCNPRHMSADGTITME